MLGSFIVITVILVVALLYIQLGYKSNAGLKESDCPATRAEYETAKRWRRTATIVAVAIALVLYVVNYGVWKLGWL